MESNHLKKNVFVFVVLACIFQRTRAWLLGSFGREGGACLVFCVQSFISSLQYAGQCARLYEYTHPLTFLVLSVWICLFDGENFVQIFFAVLISSPVRSASVSSSRFCCGATQATGAADGVVCSKMEYSLAFRMCMLITGRLRVSALPRLLRFD